MKLWRVCIKTLKEQIRSGWDLALSISLAPVFIIIYWVFMGSGAALTMDVLIVNHDLVNGIPQTCSETVTKDLTSLKQTDGTPILHIKETDNTAIAEEKIKDRQAVAAVIFPAGYSADIQRVYENGGVMSAEASAIVIGDQGHPYYAMASVFIFSELEKYVVQATGQQMPFVIQEQFVGDGKIRRDFDNYVPGLLIVSITMIIFSVSIAISREIESGTVRRLKLTRMSSIDLLGGVSLVYVFFSLISVLLSLGVALALGYHYAGSLALAVFISLMAAMAAIGAGLITACFSRTVGRAAVIANFPLLIMLFLSGAIFPLPSPPLFYIGERAIRLFDFLPTSHAVTALNKVLNLGVGMGGIIYEMAALIMLTSLLFAAGIWLFRRLQLQLR
jgi:ABC-2 type transport system permease protein